jgi:uncharacterized membrane protein YhaH (DUF805 family)
MNKFHYVDFEKKLKRGIIMGFVEAVKTCFQKYITFSGRASRSEYWYFFLFNILVGLLVMVIMAVTKLTLLGNLYTLAMLVPGTSAAVRRLHDKNRNGWWYFPVLAWFLLTLVFPYFKVEALSENPIELIAIQSSILLIILLGAFYSLILLIWFCRKGTEGDNRFGPDPLQPK